MSLTAAATAADPLVTPMIPKCWKGMGAIVVALAYVSIFHRRLRGLVLPVFVVAASRWCCY